MPSDILQQTRKIVARLGVWRRNVVGRVSRPGRLLLRSRVGSSGIGPIRPIGLMSLTADSVINPTELVSVILGPLHYAEFPVA